MPANLSFVLQNCQILGHVGLLVKLKLLMEIESSAGTANLDEQFRWPAQVFAFQARGAAALGEDSQVDVGLRCIVKEKCRCVVSAGTSGRVGLADSQPGSNVIYHVAVFGGYGRRHVDDPSNERVRLS